MNQKGFANVVLIGAVVVLIAIGGYFSLKARNQKITNTPTANWKTYTNAQHGFEFKYPENLEITQELEKRGVNLKPEDPKSKTFDYFSLHLSDKRDRQIFNFSMYINNPGMDFEETETISRTSMTIGGIQAEKEIFQYVGEGEYKGSKSVLYSFTKGNDGYMFYADGSYEMADNILSTFKFTQAEKAENIPKIEVNTSNWKTDSISSAYIYGPELNKVKIFLYASNEKKTIATTSSCGSASGSEIYNGNYKLILDPDAATSDNPGGHSDINWGSSTLDIGPMMFVKNTDWDGKFIVDQFDPIGYKNFIVLKQYGSCNLNYMRVYGYDFSQGKLVQYKFIQKNGSSATYLFVDVSSGFKKSLTGDLITSTYDNTTGKTETTEWIFDSSKDAFAVK